VVATFLSLFIVPVLYIVIKSAVERFKGGRKPVAGNLEATNGEKTMAQIGDHDGHRDR
jgi:hydrophobic/amphiphilic exporter-1 (mainly G- bacteria), HAE1 family